MPLNLAKYIDALEGVRRVEVRGRLTEIRATLCRAFAPDAHLGSLCLLHSPHSPHPLPAEVVGFHAGQALLLPFGSLHGLAPGAAVLTCQTPFGLFASDALLGRVLSGLGEPRDAGPPLPSAPPQARFRPAHSPPPDPLRRRRIQQPFWTGIRVIDSVLTFGEGQRVGLFAPAGAGKSTLLGMLARGCAADVTVVALVGERGREVRDFLERELGAESLRRTVVVVATSDEPAVVRIKAAEVATAVAEHFREAGRRVLLLVDSLTRYVRALREVGLAAGEPPTRQGYPPSVFAELPRLLERGGQGERGSVTAIYTVLVEGDDLTEVVADEARSLLDGHVVLSGRLAGEGRHPAVEVLSSVSRVMGEVVSGEWVELGGRLRRLLAAYEGRRELLAVGAYKRGTEAEVDEAVAKWGRIQDFLRQSPTEFSSPEETHARLQNLLKG